MNYSEQILSRKKKYMDKWYLKNFYEKIKSKKPVARLNFFFHFLEKIDFFFF